MRLFGLGREPKQVDPAEQSYVADVVGRAEAVFPTVFRNGELDRWKTQSAFIPGSHWKSFFARKLMQHFLDLKTAEGDELAYIYADAGDAIGERVMATWDEFWKTVQKKAVERHRNPARRPHPRLEAAE